MIEGVHDGPSAAVLAAFGARARPRRLAGGKGGTWRSGDIVLKPAEGEEETRWRAGILSALPDSPAFRVARPIRTRDGDWLCAGWEAAQALAGEPDQRRLDEVIAAGSAFHEAVAAVPRPSFLDRRSDPWAYADRLAWDGGVLRRRSELVDRLIEVRRPVSAPSRIVHGDLLGNVLFAPGHPPAVIDWPAYWRPPGWAYAVAVVDAMVWHGAGPEAADRWSRPAEWPQLLVRALIFRIATWDEAGRAVEPEEAYRAVVDRTVADAEAHA